MDCPWCDGDDTERIGAAGSLPMTEQWFCGDCDSPFEVIRKRSTDARPGRGPARTDGAATTASQGSTSDVDADGNGPEHHDHPEGPT